MTAKPGDDLRVEDLAGDRLVELGARDAGRFEAATVPALRSKRGPVGPAAPVVGRSGAVLVRCVFLWDVAMVSLRSGAVP